MSLQSFFQARPADCSKPLPSRQHRSRTFSLDSRATLTARGVIKWFLVRRTYCSQLTKKAKTFTCDIKSQGSSFTAIPEQVELLNWIGGQVGSRRDMELVTDTRILSV